ncbi:uncharacterized protein LOC122310362 [Carya illinoinensis]|uniref:uncharacterized protein LOC122310362 n=1 Tax=Carya illinoinensis TaxID=32201 RepID=UPI001C71E066|nr:uncharacterized protein LOC122310362 [Carya illinoinensis]
MTEDSLWAQFFRRKYVGEGHLSLVNPDKGTWFWKAVFKCIPMVLEHSKWLIKDGNVSFRYDKWVDNGPVCYDFPVLAYPKLKVLDCKIENEWDIELLYRLVGASKVEELCSFLASRRAGKDVLVWTKSMDGSFSSKCTWDCARVRELESRWLEWIWHKFIPTKASIIMWKALHECVSVDDRIRRVGIPMVSRCDCCQEGAYEDLNHVLYAGEFAKDIW